MLIGDNAQNNRNKKNVKNLDQISMQPENKKHASNTAILSNDKSNYNPPKILETITTPVENASDFYVRLSSLGLPLKSTASSAINPSVGSHFFQISSLTQPRNLIETRPFIADTPFTFSLTKCSESNVSTSTVTKSIPQDDQHPMTDHRTNKTPKKTSPTKHLVNDRFVASSEVTRCNTFNPFSYDNPTLPPPPPATSSIALGNISSYAATSSSIDTPFTFTLTPTLSSISTSAPLHSNHDPLFSSTFDMQVMPSTNLSRHTKKDKICIGSASKQAKVMPSTSKSIKNHVNWMTSSVNKPTQELNFDLVSSPHCVGSEEPASWSPNRMDNSSLISSSALPMLQGDLALNTISSCNVAATKLDIEAKRSLTKNHIKYIPKAENHRKTDQNTQSDRPISGSKKVEPFKTNAMSTRMHEHNTNTNNFHSVSQLLDQERETANIHQTFR